MIRQQRVQRKTSASAPKQRGMVRFSLGSKKSGQPRVNRRASKSVRTFMKPMHLWRSLASSTKLRRVVNLAGRGVAVLACAYGILFAIQSAYAYATTSPRFAARILEVNPTPHMSVDLVREQLAIPPGTNIWSLDENQLKARIEADPWIAKAEVTRHLPDTLRVHLSEHEAAAILLADRLYFVNPEGVPFKVLAAEDSKDLPLITGLPEQPVFKPSPETDVIIQRGLAALKIYQAKQRPKLSEIHVGVGGEIILYTADVGTALRLGRGSLDKIEARLRYFDALRAALGEKSEQLAVVHLDINPLENKNQRLFVRFFSPQDAAPVTQPHSS